MADPDTPSSEDVPPKKVASETIGGFCIEEDSIDLAGVARSSMLTVVELTDVNGKPKVKLDLPSPLRIGDRIRLAFHLRRQNAGRSEVLDVSGEFKVLAIGFDVSYRAKRQVIQAESTGQPLHWKAVKKLPEPFRVLSPAKSPRKTIE